MRPLYAVSWKMKMRSSYKQRRTNSKVSRFLSSIFSVMNFVCIFSLLEDDLHRTNLSTNDISWFAFAFPIVISTLSASPEVYFREFRDQIYAQDTKSIIPTTTFNLEFLIITTRTSKRMRVISGSQWPKSMKLRNLRLVFKADFLALSSCCVCWQGFSCAVILLLLD
ncbi:hypothetical protein IEQ34_012096 [Dendrobium chrysotoxum]|uniref:Uncharacterized protein n=1 Tax=Dendrobium chrysotoxum TaxID=161865 RepID=A0AAV7GSB5_DENCH|nr:hypothetical protein IEQ34_012096 [Dendrobium chrysotoxum]